MAVTWESVAGSAPKKTQTQIMAEALAANPYLFSGGSSAAPAAPAVTAATGAAPAPSTAPVASKPQSLTIPASSIPKMPAPAPARAMPKPNLNATPVTYQDIGFQFPVGGGITGPGPQNPYGAGSIVGPGPQKGTTTPAPRATVSPTPFAPGPGAAEDPYGAQSPDQLYANDPAYLATVNENKASTSQRARRYLESLQGFLYGTGNEALARSTFEKVLPQLQQYLGETPDLNPWYASMKGQDNPDTGFSQEAQFARQYRDAVQKLNEGYNSGNLFYSGARAKALDQLDYEKQANRKKMYDQWQGELSRYAQDFLDSLNQGQQGINAAAGDAYARALAAARSGQMPVAGSSITLPNATPTGGARGGTSKAPAAKKAPAVKSKPKVVRQLKYNPTGFGMPPKKKAKK